MATKFITVSIEIMHDTNLSNSQKFILAEIEQLSSLEKGCFAQNQHFADLIGIARETVSRAISDLEEKGYINVEIKNGTRNHVRIITIDEMSSLDKTSNPPKQNIKPPLTKHQETKGNITSNKTYINQSDFSLPKDTLWSKTTEEYKKAVVEHIDSFIAEKRKIAEKNGKYDWVPKIDSEDFILSMESKDYKYKNFIATYKTWLRR